MKAASGELNLTVITIIAIGAVLGFFTLFFPTIKKSIEDQWNNASKNEIDTKPSQGYIVLPQNYIVLPGLYK